MPPRIRIEEQSIILACGLPGAGKSLYGVQVLINAILNERRPVYTNLPIKWRVMRQYLRVVGGSQKYADLLYQLWDNGRFDPMTGAVRPDHERHQFGAFIHRAKKYAELREMMRSQNRNINVSEREIYETFVQRWGEHVTRGPAANWIDPHALIIIDEGHHWYAQQTQQSEPEELRAYLTMHRHHQHSILLLTQDPMQVSISFRRLEAYRWMIRKRGEDKLAWGLKFKHFGLKGLGYAKYTRDQIDGRRPTDELDPVEQFTVFPGLPNMQVYFRLYSSFTHQGSLRRQRRELERARIAAGLDAQGFDLDEPEESEHMTKKKKGFGPFLVRASKRLAVAVVLIAIGAVWATREPQIAEVLGATTQSEEPQVEWSEWTGLGRDYIRYGGRRMSPGDEHMGQRLLAFIRREKLAVFSADGYVWLWTFGDEQPSCMGRVGTVRTALADLFDGARTLQSAPVATSAGEEGGTLEPAGGDDLNVQRPGG